MKHDEKLLERAAEQTSLPVSEVLRLASARVRQHGFTAQYGSVDGPACFIGSINFVLSERLLYGSGDDSFEARVKLFAQRRREANEFFAVTLFGTRTFGCFAADKLRQEGWTDNDAAEAFDIAADYAEAIGR